MKVRDSLGDLELLPFGLRLAEYSVHQLLVGHDLRMLWLPLILVVQGISFLKFFISDILLAIQGLLAWLRVCRLLPFILHGNAGCSFNLFFALALVDSGY